MIRKMIKRFLVDGQINEKLILNNIIILLNQFGIKKSNIMLKILSSPAEFSVVKSCLIFLSSYIELDDTDKGKSNRIMDDILENVKIRYNLSLND